ncbi:MAG: NifB/NifX family molybdenum-iron cluster-binding protein [Armatimonadota bacterium]
MKIAITASNNSLEGNVDQRFGRCKYFIIYDTDTDDFEVVDNEVNLNASQGAGIQSASNLANLKVEAVITGHTGPNAFRTLSAANIIVYAGVSGNISDAILMLKNNQLIPAQNADVEGHWQSVKMSKHIIAVASGKGGTGKTTISANLAYTASKKLDIGITYLDCDVEEPNGHIFLSPNITNIIPVSVPMPIIDESKCTACGKCKEICQFNAIAVLGKTVMTFPTLCHGCGGCMLVCHEKAISESSREIGVLEHGKSEDIFFVHGKLNIKEAMSPPLIRKVKEHIPNNGLIIIDAPPGTSCPVIQSINSSDYVILVTEPTPFGLNDLILAVDMLRELKLPFSVVVNRSNIGDDRVRTYCKEENIKILLEIPHQKAIAEAYSRGKLIAKEIDSVGKLFNELLENIIAEMKLPNASNSNVKSIIGGNTND